MRLLNRSLPPEEVSVLYGKYGYFLRRRCRTILRDEALADDALQEAFVKIMRSGGSIREVDEPLRWLYRVVDHCCFDALRRRRRAADTQREHEGASAHPGVAIELRDAVLRMLGAFDEEQMRIALLLVIDGMSQREIADEVGISRVTVNKKIQAIRTRAAAWLGHEPQTEGPK